MSLTPINFLTNRKACINVDGKLTKYINHEKILFCMATDFTVLCHLCVSGNDKQSKYSVFSLKTIGVWI